MKCIYLASPYSHKNPFVMAYRFYKITKIAAKLYKKHKVCMFLPITQSALMQLLVPSLGGSFKNWADVDIEAINRCDEVWVVTMKGWKESVGVTAEINHAFFSYKPVLFIDPDSLEIKKSMKTIPPKRNYARLKWLK